MEHVDYPHTPGTLYDCPTCAPILSALNAADAAGVELDYEDFTLIDGEYLVDGMDPLDWIAAMSLE